MPTFTHLGSSLWVSPRSRWLYVLVWPWLVPLLSYLLLSRSYVQLLVENAVKHNVIQARRPLRILIATTPSGTLCVRNNIQPKTTQIESTRVGLVNISARYQLLTQQSPVVEATAEQFAVTLPLLAPT